MWCKEPAKFPVAPAEPVCTGSADAEELVAYQNTRALMNSVRDGVYMPPLVLNEADGL